MVTNDPLLAQLNKDNCFNMKHYKNMKICGIVRENSPDSLLVLKKGDEYRKTFVRPTLSYDQSTKFSLEERKTALLSFAQGLSTMTVPSIRVYADTLTPNWLGNWLKTSLTDLSKIQK